MNIPSYMNLLDLVRTSLWEMSQEAKKTGKRPTSQKEFDLLLEVITEIMSDLINETTKKAQ